jgi:hypothetical protein
MNAFMGAFSMGQSPVTRQRKEERGKVVFRHDGLPAEMGEIVQEERSSRRQIAARGG